MKRRSPYRATEVRKALDDHKARLVMLVNERDIRWEYFYSLCVQGEEGSPLRLALLRWEAAFDRVACLARRIYGYEERQRDALTPMVIQPKPIRVK